MQKRKRHSRLRNLERSVTEITYPPEKRCSRCKTTKPGTDFHKHRQEKDGLKSYCKACAAKARNSWYSRNAEAEIAKTAAWQKDNPDKVKTYARRTYQKHHTSRRERIKAAYYRDRDTILQQNRDRYATDDAFRQAKLMQCHASYRRRAEKIKEYRKQYRADNRERVKQLSNTARIRKLNAPGHCSFEQWLEILERYDFHCAYCCKHESVVGRMTIDHMDPLSRGGSNDPDNIVPACHRCNCSKNNRSLIEFAGLWNIRSNQKLNLVY